MSTKQLANNFRSMPVASMVGKNVSVNRGICKGRSGTVAVAFINAWGVIKVVVEGVEVRAKDCDLT